MQKWLRLGPGWLLAVWLGLSLIGVGFFLRDSQFWLSYFGDSTEPESSQVQIVLWASQSGHVYTDPSQPPYTPALYGPLFYETMLTLARLGRFSRFDDLLFAGRLLVFLCFLGIPVLTYLWCRRSGLSIALAALSSALLLSHPEFVRWGASFRPDVLGILLSLLAFYLVSRQEVPSLRSVIGAGVCVSLAWLFKQTFIAAPAAILIWLGLEHRFRQIVTFLITAAVPVVLLLGALSLHGEPVGEQFFLLRHLPFSLPSALGVVVDALFDYPAGGLEIALALLWLPRAWHEPPSRKRLLALYFVLASITALGALLQIGSYRNHLLEGWVLCAILVPFGLQRMMETWQDVPQLFRAVVLLMILVILSLGLGNWGGNEEPQQEGELAAALQNATVFSDIPYIAAHGQNPELLDLFACRVLEVAGYWSPAPVVRQLREKRFDYIVLMVLPGGPRGYRGYTLLSPSVREEIERSYEPYCLYGDGYYAVLRPRDSGPPDRQTRSALLDAGCLAPQPRQFKLDF